jgi:hypothetical protein
VLKAKQQTNKFPKLGGIRATLFLGIVYLDISGHIQIPAHFMLLFYNIY